MAHIEADEFKQWMDAMADALLVCDGLEHVLYLNRAAELLLGWPREELQGQSFSVLVPPRFQAWKEGSLLRHLLGKRLASAGRSTLVPLRHRTGVELALEAVVSHTGEQASERVVLTLRHLPEVPDATAEPLEVGLAPYPWQHAHQGLAHVPTLAERLYQLIFENAPLGLFHFGNPPFLIACNDQFAGLLGSTRQQLLGLNLLTLRDTRVMDCIRVTLQGQHTRYEGNYVSTTTGKCTPLRAHFAPFRDEHGQVVGGVGIVEDITAQRRMEQERDTQLALASTLLRTAPVGMAFYDTRLRFVHINDVLASVTGQPPEAYIGHTLPEMLGPPGVLLDQFLRHVMETGQPLERLEVSAREMGLLGTWEYCNVSMYPVRAPDGRILGLGSVVEDTTGAKHAEQERLRLLREAQEAVRVRDDFLTIASHELKTPLTPLSLRLATLERKLERGEPLDASALQQARGHLMRLTTLINDLLDSSRIESGGLALHPQPTRLDVLIEHVIRVTEAFREAGNRIAFHVPVRPIEVMGDPYRLEQVIANLLENALKYSPDGGTIHVSLEARGEVVLMTVSDPGIGIPSDQQKHLFERHFRARNVSTHSYGGLGLGLYICRDIVARHGGSIWVESEVGRGSTFYVALPTLQASRALTGPTPEPQVH
ncbi:PAS domain S-box-containing protein [Stigmatella erecta]|uniref:histidine kinase n=2 Tax=Stigmatella erecta TaxID=83460 RepID=A0A1I0L5L9_9BACT|nr:PAS domain S-box protein [Stigmatella erecta]SEU33989.1 PAS domain S-box-containing protein [Stigmatella erecta]